MTKGRKTGGRTAKAGTLTSMKLDNDVRSLATLVGNGDRTAGVEKLFSQLPVFYRVKRYLETQDDDVAASLVLEMEELEIDRVYEEAIAEGVIKTPSGSWIV